jgi:hypothetical protein
MHDLSSGEFVNIGVVMFEPTALSLKLKLSDRYQRVSEFFGGISGNAYRAVVRQIERSLVAASHDLRQPSLLAESPGSLSAVLGRVAPDAESSLRFSEVMYGVSEKVDLRLEELFDEFVRKYETRDDRIRREESDVGQELDRQLIKSGLWDKVKFDYQIQAEHYRFSFHAAWQNGKTQVLQPISFDLVDEQKIVEKATRWTGRLYNLSQGADFGFNGVLARPQDRKLDKALNEAIAILSDSPLVRNVVLEEDADSILDQIRDDTKRAGRH